jgi:hypothetical protein
MPIPLKDEKSIKAIMSGSPSGTSTFFYPTEEGTLCFHCKGQSEGRISKLDNRTKVY